MYFLKDHPSTTLRAGLGSIRATVLDSAVASVVGYSDYDPWGYILAKRDTAHAVLPAATRNKFTGKEWDDDYGVNWFHSPWRPYDPEIARWMVRDLLEMKYPSWSPYVYTLDNPIKFLDPDGRGIRKPGSIVRFAIISFYMNNLMSWHNREAHDYTVFLEHIQGKSLSEVMHEADTRNNTLSYSAGGPFEAVKYIKDPAFPNRIIDMRHFLVVGQKGNLFGLGIEIGQALRLKDSGFNLEDFYSNFMGSLFFDYFFDPNSDKAFEEQLKEFFELWHKTYQEQRPEKEEQQKEDDKN